ncbi:MAG: hypothetical protein IJ379_06895 [Lachnospiraceae bacterium]|nr:hypothetical protein [Lachnospiraceae bacterium]MBQ7775631.1 hypothetical protein [Lachnospiraceae bacterium]
MAYQFVEKKSRKQQENAYIVYMMLGSFFEKAVCKAKFLEKSLFLYYKDLSAEKQVKREEEILNDLEKQLAQYMDELKDNNCQVHIQYKDENYVLQFVADNMLIETIIDKKGSIRLDIGDIE